MTNSNCHTNYNFLENISKLPPFIGLGSGVVRTHWGEILQGQFPRKGKSAYRALVTLHCPNLCARATFIPSKTCSGKITVIPANRRKATDAARRTLQHIERRNWGGELVLNSNIPEKVGGGSSSGDVVATIRAVAHAFGVTLDNETVAKLAVSAEAATDSIMYSDGNAVLFAQRDGIPIETLGPLPRLRAVGFTDGQGIDTLAYPPANYTAVEIGMFQSLLEHTRQAITKGDARALAEVATASATINQRHLPKPSFSTLVELIGQEGVIGMAVSHSGSAVSFLLDGDDPRVAHQQRLVAQRLKNMGFQNVIYFDPSCQTPFHPSLRRER